jgi:putative ABC transport system substrate-binding protein
LDRRKAFRRTCGVAALVAAALLFPWPARAQPQGKLWRIGVLTFQSRPEPNDAYFSAFVAGLRELGYVEGKNVVIDWRFAEGSFDRLSALAGDVAAARLDVIVTHSTQAAQAMKRATSTAPIVMVGVGDPVGAGLVASLSRPGGNVTGLSNVAVDLGGKHFELLRAALPKLGRIAVLINPTHPAHPQVVKQVQAAAAKASASVLVIQASKPDDIEQAMARLTQERADAFIVAPDPLFLMQRKRIADLSAKSGVASMSWTRDLAVAGGLMSYGQNLAEQFRRAAVYVDKILRGAKPGDLPIEQPTKIELVINLKTAKAIGVTIPEALLARADEIIQ